MDGSVIFFRTSDVLFFATFRAFCNEQKRFDPRFSWRAHKVLNGISVNLRLNATEGVRVGSVA